MIRLATPQDAAAISDCVAAAYVHYIDRLGQPPGPMVDDYDKIIHQHTVYVVQNETGHSEAAYSDAAHNKETSQSSSSQVEPSIAGVLVLVDKAGYFLLDNIAVHPECQGRGIGRQLMTLAETVARQQGHESIHLYTHELMRENIALYAKSGYVETERRTEHGFRRVYMQKVLAL